MAKRKGGKIEMIRTSITMSLGLYKDLQHIAVEEDKTLKELMNKAIEEYVRRRRSHLAKPHSLPGIGLHGGYRP
jgi:hypothetical protein